MIWNLNFRVTRRRAKDFFHEKLKTWIDLHGAWRSGIVWLKNKMIPFVKGFQFTTTSCSSTKKVTEQFAIEQVAQIWWISLDKPFAMFTDAYLQVVKTSTSQVNKIN